MRSIIRGLAILTLLATLPRCADSVTPACRVGADCASGVCSSDGRCLAADDVADPPSGFTDTSPGEDAAGTPDGFSGQDGGDPDSADDDTGAVTFPDVTIDPDASTPTCQPNHDFIIARNEAPFPTGVTVTYRTASAKEAGSPISVDLAGYVDDDGLRHWTLEKDLPTDTPLAVTTDPVTADRWFAESFPGATYTARLSADVPLLGVFETTPTALLLRGVVSPESGTFATELVYETPVVVLSFPVAEGGSWDTETKIDGKAEGVPCFSVGGCSEHYRNEVDAHGVLDTPFGAFRVLRIRVELDRTVGFATTTTRTFLFVAECFATVGTVVSRSNEVSIEFDKAAEVRRIAPE